MKKQKNRAFGAAQWAVGEVDHLFLAVARYTRFVLYSKWFLGVFALALLGGLILWPLVAKDVSGMRISFQSTDAKPDAATAPVMQAPHFTGDDAKGQRYSITGTRATQRTPQLVFMEQVQSQLVRPNGSVTILNADTALFHQDTKVADLNGNVTLIEDKGTIFVTPSAVVNTDTMEVDGQEHIEGTNNMGKLVATGFKIRDKGNRIFFGTAVPGITVHIDKMRQK